MEKKSAPKAPPPAEKERLVIRAAEYFAKTASYGLRLPKNPDRVLIHEGPLKQKKTVMGLSDRIGWLFTDYFILTKTISESALEPKRWTPLYEVLGIKQAKKKDTYTVTTKSANWNLIVRDSKYDVSLWIAVLNKAAQTARVKHQEQQLRKRVANFMQVCSSGMMKEVRAALTEDPALIQRTMAGGRTGLHMSVSLGHLDVARYLIEQKADYSSVDEKGQTALHMACAHADYELTEYLLELKASVAAQDKDKNTPLWIAATKGNDDFAFECVELCIKAGADPNCRHPGTQRPLLLDTSALDRPQSLQALLDNGAQRNIICLERGRTALHSAASAGIMSTIRILIGNAVGPNLADNDLNTPLHLVTDLKIAVYLIASGARISQSNKRGEVGGLLLPKTAEVKSSLRSAENTFNSRVDQKNDGQVREPESWMDDEMSVKCLLCSLEFSWRLRRHHCRRCGLLVCGNCSSKNIKEADSRIRACDCCFNMLSHRWQAERKKEAEIKKREDARAAKKAKKDATAEAERQKYRDTQAQEHEEHMKTMAQMRQQEEGAVDSGMSGVSNKAKQTSAVLKEARNQLLENTEKINQLEDKSARLAQGAQGYAALARKIREQQEKNNSWF